MNLIVGATGFVGSHVIEYFFKAGEISRATFRKGAHLKVIDQNGVQGIEADLLDHHSLHEAMEGVDTVVSMASPTPGSGEAFEPVNTQGTRNLLETARELGVKTFIHLSALDVYPPGLVEEKTVESPSSRYGRAKLEADRVALGFSSRNQTPRVVIVRAAKAIGKWDGAVASPILRMISTGTVVLPRGGNMSWTHPRDIGQGILKTATTNLPSGSVVMLKSFDSSIEEVAEAIAKEAGKPVKVKKQGLLAKSPISADVQSQIKASRKIEVQQAWTQLGYSPEFGLTSMAQEVAKWGAGEPWALSQQ